MENWQLALVVIAALFVGVLIPTVIQYQVTLRSVHRVIRSNESDIRRILGEVSQFSAHLNRIGASLDGNTQHVKTFLSALEDLVRGINKVRGTLRTASIVGATVGPAIGAAIRAWQSGQGDPVESFAAEMERQDGTSTETDGESNGIHI